MLTTSIPLRHNATVIRPQRLMLKDLFMQILLVKLLCNTLPHTRLKFEFKYRTRKLFMTTRAPYRYKLTRNQYLLERYHYSITLYTPIKKPLTFERLPAGLLQFTEALGLLSIAHGNLKTVRVSLPALCPLLTRQNGRI